MKAHVLVLNQRHTAKIDLVRRPAGSHEDDFIVTSAGKTRLRELVGAYLRLMDHRLLPEMDTPSERAERWQHADGLYARLDAWANTTAARVINPPASMLSNASKPYQAQLLRAGGFRVPETLVTDDPREVRRFARKHRSPIYKSVSGVRSIVRRLDRQSMKRLNDVEAVPTQFQEYIPGFDLRLHVVGDRWVSTRIVTEAVDYRYAMRDGFELAMGACDAPSGLGERCVAMAGSLGLRLAGFDFRVTNGGDAYCLEVNPMPMFSFYEERSGQAISELIALYLTGRGMA